MTDRVANLELAALKAEGAHYALHDLVARALVRIPDADFRILIDGLRAHADDLEAEIGSTRINAYREELESVAHEVESARVHPRGLLSRFRVT